MRPMWKHVAGLTLAAGLVVAGAQAGGRRVSADAPALPAATGQTITVTGSGSVSVAPDEAVVDLGVTTKAADAQGALTQDGTQMAAVVAAVEKAGVAKQDIRTSDLQVGPDYQPGPTPKIDGFRATNMVQVTVRDLTMVGAIVDDALQAGANQVQGINFTVSDPESVSRQAMQSAVADAQAAAAVIAAAAGLHIVGVRSVSENSGCCVGPVFAAASRSAAPVSTPVLGGQQTVNVDLQVVYDVTR